MTTTEWISTLRAAHPGLPERLTIELEMEMLARLEGWFGVVRDLQSAYEHDSTAAVFDGLAGQPGGRLVIPVLVAVPSMTEAEVHAWHTLFVCLSAHMVDKAYRYWNNTKNSTDLELADVLDHLPVVFLYVLAGYDPYPEQVVHEVDFSHSDDNRVRLNTWLGIESRRHIVGYLQRASDSVRNGSTYAHRLRQALTTASDSARARLGREPNRTEVQDELRAAGRGHVLPAAGLTEHAYHTIMTSRVLSMDAPLSEDSTTTLSGVLPAEDSVDVEQVYDPIEYVRNRVGLETLQICARLWESDTRLGPSERAKLRK